MATRIRLTRKGRKRNPIYRVVVADSRAPRDGKFLEMVGFYDPNQNPAIIRFESDAIIDWLKKGAQPSDTVKSLLKRDGIWAKYDLIRKGEDVSSFEATKKELLNSPKKPTPKATARAQAAEEAAAAPAVEVVEAAEE